MTANTTQRVDVLTVDALAQAIRIADRKHCLGAGALAEALWPHYEALLLQVAEQAAEIERRGDWRTQAQMNAHLFHEEQASRIAAERAREEAIAFMRATLAAAFIAEKDEWTGDYRTAAHTALDDALARFDAAWGQR